MKQIIYILIGLLITCFAPCALPCAAQTEVPQKTAPATGKTKAQKPKKQKKEKILTSEGEPDSATIKHKPNPNDPNTPSSYQQRVGSLPARYLFGVAIGYADSVAYITPVCEIKDMAYDLRTKTPIGLDLYTESLRTYLQTQGHTDYVCSTFLCKSRKEADKQATALRRRWEKSEVCRYLPLDGFAYQRIATEQIFTNAGDNSVSTESDDSDF